MTGPDSSEALPHVRVVVAEVSGSTPREPGAAMVVHAGGMTGTIGGGALEFDAERAARAMLADPAGAPARKVVAMPLGPGLGQCCGGHVRLWFERVDAEERQAPGGARLILRGTSGGAPVALTDRKDSAFDALPPPVARAARAMLAGERPEAVRLLRGVGSGDAAEDWLIEPVARRATPLWVYGAGHVGRALVRALEGLDFDLCWVDTARERFPEPVPAHASMLVAVDPADAAGMAPAGAIHFVMSFSHAVDLAICHRLLARNDFARLGLIGSETKRARFRRRLLDGGIAPAALERMTCPIGVGGVASKTPAAIAIGVAAQALQWRDAMGREGIGREGGAGAEMERSA